MSYRTILAAPGIGMVHATYGAEHMALSDRVANGDAHPGEMVVRVPRRIARDMHARWWLQRSNLRAAFDWIDRGYVL